MSKNNKINEEKTNLVNLQKTQQEKPKSSIDYNNVVLEVKDLRKHFVLGKGKSKLVVPAVDGVSFNIHKREVFGLVGESGCGKTTTGRTIIKLYKPTDGYVALNGKKITAGFSGNLREIKRIKKNAQKEITNLYEHKRKKAEILEIKKRKLKELNAQLDAATLELDNNLKDIKQIKKSYYKSKYEIKNKFVERKNNLKYNLKLEIEQAKEKMQNFATIEYDNKLASLKLGNKRKKSGIKTSEALLKEEINKRLEQLKQAYEQSLFDAKVEYIDSFDEAEEQRITKEKFQEIKTKGKEKYTEKLEKAKKEFLEANNNLCAPNKQEIIEKTNECKINGADKIKDIKSKIALVKVQATKDIAAIVKEELEQDKQQEINKKIKEINDKKIEDIKVQKNEIKEIKKIYGSKETDRYARKMQMIFQDPISSLNPRMTVEEIISEGLVIKKEDSKTDIKQKVLDILETVGLSKDYVSRYPHEFSGGQRQRIGIARALIMNPDFIIADEPISALDVSIRAQVINLLSDLKEELGLTVLFIAHDLSVVRFFCDKIAVMYFGKIVELSETEELFKNPIHPYTKSLLSAIPQPDPDTEKNKQKIQYDPRQHNYLFDKPKMREITKDHFVLCNDEEYQQILKHQENKEKSI